MSPAQVGHQTFPDLQAALPNVCLAVRNCHKYHKGRENFLDEIDYKYRELQLLEGP